ncbi:MAG: hypothetical protein AAFW75_16095 [Cyanobacteria bacterium J06636_16]
MSDKGKAWHERFADGAYKFLTGREAGSSPNEIIVPDQTPDHHDTMSIAELSTLINSISDSRAKSEARKIYIENVSKKLQPSTPVSLNNQTVKRILRIAGGEVDLKTTHESCGKTSGSSEYDPEYDPELYSNEELYGD